MNIVTDLEGTLTTGSTWKAMREYLKKFRDGRGYGRFTLKWMPRFLLVQLGLFSKFRARIEWMDDEIAMLTDTTDEELDRMGEWIVEHEMWPKRRLDILGELAKHQENGARVVLATGTYMPVAKSFAARCGFEVAATALKINNGQAVIEGDHCTGRWKLMKAKEVLEDEEIAIAYGDTIADRETLEAAATAVAVHPHQELRRMAELRGWRIVGRK